MKHARLALPMMLTALGGCMSLAPDTRVPETVTQLPEVYENPDASGEYRPQAWWRDFEDETLNALVDEALGENLDIAEAAARVERASAQARIARAGLLPTLDASAGASYSDSPLSGSPFGGLAGGGGRLKNESYSLNLGAAYELDLFGRARSDLLAARADARAAEFDFRAVQLAAAAEAISTYFEIVDSRRQIELALITADVLADRVQRTEERYRRGLSESFELYQVRQELRTVQASLPQRESALSAAEGRLAVLLRDRIARPLQPRLSFEDVPAGLPQQLLSQRPDVAAAWQRLEASRHAIGASRAQRFPSIRLTGSLGSQGDTISSASNVADNWAVSLASSIVAPLFDGGRISAGIAAARATYDERAAAYARAVLNAYREVSSATEDYEEQRQRYRLIASQLAEAEASRDLQARRFRSGVGGYVAYLDAVRAVYQVRSSLSSAARDVALARLGVHRALGGDWTSETPFTPVTMTEPAPPASAEGDTP